MKRRWRKQHLSQPAEVNITAFMNLMVILVPFLLITAVFSRITILDLNLPVPGDPKQVSKQDDKPKLHLEVIVRENVVEIGDRERGRCGRMPRRSARASKCHLCGNGCPGWGCSQRTRTW